MNKLFPAWALLLAAPLALAKLPALDDAAKAKAAEAAARTAWQGKVEAFQLCKAQDRVAAHYRKGSTPAAKGSAPEAKSAASAKGAASAKSAGPAASTCADPGPFAYTPPDQKPPEASAAKKG
jgi:hypothetical protein